MKYSDCRAASRALAAIVVLAAFPGCRAIGTVASFENGGPLRYRRIVREHPVALHIHVLQIDLASPDVSLHVEVGPRPPPDVEGEVLVQSPMVLAENGGLAWAINTNPWHHPDNTRTFPSRIGEPAMINGWAVSEGEHRSATCVRCWEFWVDREGRARIGNADTDEPDPDSVRLGVGGWVGLIREGEVLRKAPDGRRAPRSALGLDREGRMLTMVVVDKGVPVGAPGWREVMDLYELAALMRELGCWNAYNLDGGGSSILVRRDDSDPRAPRWQPVNRQAGRFQRPLPMVLGVRIRRGGS